MGTCPKCEAVVLHVNIEEITASAFMGQQWRAIKYCCPSCGCVLSVAIDPIALRTDRVELVVAELRKR